MSETRTEHAAGDDEEFRAIEAAVAQSARGRWFLAEFARRNRGADTDLVLAALDRLGSRMAGQGAPSAAQETPSAEPARAERQALEAMRASLSAMATAIARDAREAAAIRHPVGGPGAFTGLDGLEAVTLDLETGCNAVLDSAEHIQEIAWILRERGADGAACDRLDQRASDIYTASAGQDAALKRLKVLLRSVRLVDRHLAALGEAFQIEPAEAGPKPEPGEQAPPAAADDDLDFVLVPEAAAEPAPVATARPAASEPAVPAPEQASLQPESEAERRRRENLAILAEIDGLDLHEKLKLFT